MIERKCHKWTVKANKFFLRIVRRAAGLKIVERHGFAPGQAKASGDDTIDSL